MSGKIHQLDALRFLERVQERDLARTRRWIADAERREAERLQGERMLPPTPDWLIELGIGSGRAPVYVHVEGCHMAKNRTRSISEEQARRALWDQVPACTHCKPDVELGVID